MDKEIAWLLREKYHGMESEDFQTDCARLSLGVPLAYIIGHVPFLDCTIHLDSHPLIPRPETEYWVEQAITVIRTQSSRRNLELEKEEGLAFSLKVLDLCAGSGAIGVAVAKAEPSALVSYAEIDPAHLSTIEKNYHLNVPVNRYIKVVEGDLFNGIDVNERFDFILTNPPYIDVAAHTVNDNVVEHEPHLALFGGDSGMELIARIIVEAPHYLIPLGQLWIEHEPAQVEAMTSLALEHGFSIITHPDQYGIPRFSVLTMAQ